jgi:hypothetical protein
MYILSESCKYAGFRGFRHDEDMRAGDPVSMQPHVTNDDEGDDNIENLTFSAEFYRLLPNYS